MESISISNPAHPVRLGGFNTSGQAKDVVVAGNLAYVADGTAGLQVIDVSNPASPVWLGGYDTSGYANGVALAGNYVYVADGPAGLQVINVSDPAHPVRTGGCLLYTSDAADDLLCVDLGGRRIIKKKNKHKTRRS